MNKYYYRFSGYAFLVLGILGFLVSIYMYMFPAQTLDLDALRSEKLASCEVIGKSHGYEVERQGLDIITFRKESFLERTNSSDPTVELMNSSTVATRCDGLELAYYCMGEECKMNGVSVEMKLKTNITY